jgi:hypothetical protein
MIEKNHCCPRALDERLSTDILTAFINSLDKEHLFFTSSDITFLKENRKVMDQGLHGQTPHFFKQGSFPLRSPVEKSRFNCCPFVTSTAGFFKE